MVGKFLSGKFGIQVVDIAFKNFTVGYFAASALKYSFINEQSGILKTIKKCKKVSINYLVNVQV